MPQRDIYHNAVKNALVSDGWTITHDPLTLSIGAHRTALDVGAQKGDRKLVVVICRPDEADEKTAGLGLPLGRAALGQTLLKDREPTRTVFLAVPEDAFRADWFDESWRRELLAANNLALYVIRAQQPARALPD